MDQLDISLYSLNIYQTENFTFPCHGLIPGCEPLIQLYETLLKAPGVYGARFSGAGFRGCCVALVAAERAEEAATFVRIEYSKLQPDLASHIKQGKAVLICDAGDSAHII